jgi:hypothetical protein
MLPFRFVLLQSDGQKITTEALGMMATPNRQLEAD